MDILEWLPSHCSRRDKPLYSVVLCGGDALVSAVLQALVLTQCSTDKLSFAVVPLGEQYPYISPTAMTVILLL